MRVYVSNLEINTDPVHGLIHDGVHLQILEINTDPVHGLIHEGIRLKFWKVTLTLSMV